MIPDDFVDSTEFCSIEATASLQPDRIEPELGDLVLTLDVNVLRFIAIAGVKEQSIRAYPEYCWHLLFVSNCSLASLLNLLRAKGYYLDLSDPYLLCFRSRWLSNPWGQLKSR